MTDQYQKEKLFLTAGESKTFGFDFSKHGGVRAGEEITDPVFEFVDTGSGVDAGTPVVITEDFLDFGTGAKIPADKGVAVLLDGTGSLTPGTYTVSMSVAIGTDPAVKILGELVVTDAGGAIP